MVFITNDNGLSQCLPVSSNQIVVRELIITLPSSMTNPTNVFLDPSGILGKKMYIFEQAGLSCVKRMSNIFKFSRQIVQFYS